MSPVAALGVIGIIVLTLATLAFLIFADRKNEPVRRRDLKKAQAELAEVRAVLREIEDHAVANPDGFVLNADILRITRSV